jgi:hypothetical protein
LKGLALKKKTVMEKRPIQNWYGFVVLVISLFTTLVVNFMIEEASILSIK